MQNVWLWMALPLISGFIGWITNLVAIKMLFHPRLPVNVLGLKIQGIFPKRQQQFAEKLGKLVSNELLSFEEIAGTISSAENLQKLSPVVEAHIDLFLKEKLAKEMPMISMFIGDKTVDKLKGLFMEELQQLFPTLMERYTDQIRHQLDLEKIVTEKVQAFSSDKLEEILFQIMSKEFRFVEIIGGVLGFIIGLVQVAITVLLR